jgi:hypothetical protein
MNVVLHSVVDALNIHIVRAASSLDGPLGITNPGGLPDDSASGIIGKIVLWLLGIISIIALAVLVYGGLMYILSFGDEKKAEKAKYIIMYAIIGVIVAGASFAIMSTVKSILIPTTGL